jgi:carbonic anhydrase
MTTRLSLVKLAVLVTACAPRPSRPPAAHAEEGEVCKHGRYQSPIDLHAVAERGEAALRFEYRPDTLRIVNNGHTVQVDHHAGSKLWTGDEAFELAQYHIHSPSEHTVEGQHYPLEIHFVHRNAAGLLAVVGVLVAEGEEAPRQAQAVGAVWDHLPAHSGEHAELAIEVDPLALIPGDHRHFFYRGSLTTPPCTETVRWHVLTTPLAMSAQHIARFREIYSANARPIQRPDWCPLHDAP